RAARLPAGPRRRLRLRAHGVPARGAPAPARRGGAHAQSARRPAGHGPGEVQRDAGREAAVGRGGDSVAAPPPWRRRAQSERMTAASGERRDQDSARAAGTSVASSATRARVATTSAKTAGSWGRTPKSTPPRRRETPQAAG